MRPSTPSHFRVVHWNPDRRSTTIEEFMMRPTFDPEAERIAADLLADIRARGEAAILAAMARIDGVTVHPTELRVSAKEFDAAEDRLAPAVKGSILAPTGRSRRRTAAASASASHRSRAWASTSRAGPPRSPPPS